MREKIWVKLQKGLLGKQILRKPRKKDGKKSVRRWSRWSILIKKTKTQKQRVVAGTQKWTSKKWGGEREGEGGRVVAHEREIFGHWSRCGIQV